MQTFLPVTQTYDSMASHLDNRRLNKQALEGWQILMTLLELDPDGNHRKPKGWVNHPAVKMWRGHELALYEYIMSMVKEWKQRGYKSTIGDKATETIRVAYENALLDTNPTKPDWMTDTVRFERIAASHRRALLVKEYSWYSQFHWAEDPGTQPTDYEYIWPVE